MKISICIPTYNRGEILYQNVLKCLECTNIDIEVVVSNNCSEDNTEELLFQIKDERFKYFKNKYNNGGDNLISVLTYATGDYLLLTSDEDTIISENLEKVIPILESEKPAVLKASASLFGEPYTVHRDGIYEKGFDAINVYSSGCTYMSGYIFNSEIMRKVLNGVEGTDINRRFGYRYNFTNLTREMLQYGSLYFSKEIITNQFKRGTLSKQTYFDDGVFYCSPIIRLKDVYERMDCLKRLYLTEKQKYFLCEKYRTKGVWDMWIVEYKETFSDEFLKKLDNDEDAMVYEYYLKNQEILRKNDAGIEIKKLDDKCIEYIDKIEVFTTKYENLSEKYKDIHDEFEQRRKNTFEKFQKEVKGIVI